VTLVDLNCLTVNISFSSTGLTGRRLPAAIGMLRRVLPGPGANRIRALPRPGYVCSLGM